MKYRKKPVVVEAIQWIGFGASNISCVTKYRQGQVSGICEECGKPRCVHGWVHTKEGGHIVCPFDWIITGVKGEKYPCKPDIFEQTYEKVSD